jgi:O-antigen/teichoic acid export membrane protein
VVSAFTIPPVLIFSIAAIPTFRRYHSICPSLKSIDYSLGKSLINKGVGFFFIQITSCLVIYGSSNLFVAHYSGPVEVTHYGIAYKFFNLLSVAYTIFLTPYWSAYTDAYAKNDIEWIKKTFRKTLLVLGGMFIIGCCMFITAPLFYSIWVGDSVNIPWQISFVTFIYIVMFNLNNCATFLINGLNKIKVQIITSVIFTIFYLIVVMSFGDSFGVTGIVLSMAIVYFMMAIIHLYQCGLLINLKARSIWNE